jgi:enterochelin esterase-like enzyme
MEVIGSERSHPTSRLMRRILLCFSVAALLPATAQANSPQRSDSVSFVSLRATASQKDCDLSPPTISICRVKRRVDAGALSASLAKGEDVIRDGHELTFARRAEAKSVELSGGVQYPMSRVVGTDLWVVTVRISDVDHALISYGFFVADERLQPGTKLQTKEWRGPLAPAPALKSVSVAGTIRVDTLPSRYLSHPRAVVTYVPPSRGNAPIAGVVYMGDGGSVQGIAPYIDTLIVTGQLPRVMLVGVPSGQADANDPPDTDVRAMEYLWGFEESNARFLAHENFVVREVIPWAEGMFGAPHSQKMRAIWGISNSGGWAITMALRHPDLFGKVLSFSPGGSHGTLPEGATLSSSVNYLLQGGVLEPAFRGIAGNWRDTLQAHGITSTLRELVAGHDWLAWCEAFPAAIRWAWMRDEQTQTNAF